MHNYDLRRLGTTLKVHSVSIALSVYFAIALLASPFAIRALMTHGLDAFSILVWIVIVVALWILAVGRVLIGATDIVADKLRSLP